MNILIIEDNSGDLYLIEEIMLRTNLKINRLQSCKTMHEAKQILKENWIDLIFLDIFLPDVSGVSAFQNLDPRSTSAAIIVLTGLQDETIAMEALKHGVQDYLVKGEFDEKLLEKSVRYAVERKSNEETLQQSKERYKILFEGNPIPMWAFDMETYQIVMVNNAAVNHYGYSMNEFSTMTIMDLRPPEEKDILIKYLNTNNKNQINKSGEWRHLKKDGTLIDVEIASHIIPWGNTKVRLVAAYDITERKKTQDHLHLLESVITNTNDSVLICKIDNDNLEHSKVIYINDAFTKMTGYQFDEVLEKSSMLLQGLTSDSGEIEKIKEALIRRESTEFELLNRKKNGDHFWNNFTIVPVADKNGVFTHWVSIQRDVTARKQHEEIARKKLEKLIEERTRELHQALANEKELVEMKSRFVAIASHEFRTPLSTINFATNFLQDHFQQLSVEEISSKLKRIEKQVTHMTSLLEDVILVGRNELNKIQVIRSTVQIRNFIDKILEEVLQTTKNTHAIKLDYEVTNLYLEADEKLLRNIIINLLTNAIKFSPAQKEIQVIIRQQDQYLVLSVIDKGIGISESDQKHLYEAFYRGKNASAIAGSGLGLSIVKKAVELLNGEMELKSELSKGTQIKVKLPLA